ncbi:MAG: hypothetical protein Pg6C_16670 [Treponemataceae bacterium]|nr:MAG: hypothetical protein Pg6C_16670 [Treponemataceae bacterium]
MNKWTEKEIQFALTYSQRHSPFYIRSHICVTNVSWGADFNHELDLLSVSKAGYGTETEIKISVSDLKRDLEKTHCHKDNRIRQLFFAGPAEMKEALLEYAPENAGVITVERDIQQGYWTIPYYCYTIRKPKINQYAVKFTEKEIQKLLRLGNMRFWSLLRREFMHSKKKREGK